LSTFENLNPDETHDTTMANKVLLILYHLMGWYDNLCWYLF
jgi:hypothetical protein